MNALRGKREVENKTETHKTDGWENQRQFVFLKMFLNKIFLPVKIEIR
jgi:hypothetical protein